MPPESRRRGRPRQVEPSPQYQARLAEIVESAARVFHEKGYEAGSLDDVAGALDLRKASLYHYVHSKAELLYLIFDRAITSGLQQLSKLAANEDPAKRLIGLIDHQVRLMAAESSMFTVFFDQRPRLDGVYEERIRAKERRYLATYADAVAAASDAGVIPAVDPRYGAQAILGMTSWVYKWLDPERDDPEAFIDACGRLLLGAPPGTRLTSARGYARDT